MASVKRYFDKHLDTKYDWLMVSSHLNNKAVNLLVIMNVGLVVRGEAKE
jgi:hypothetical protein